MLDAYKELVPVIYGENAIKCLPRFTAAPNSLCFKSHWHDRMEFLVIMSGQLHAHLGDEQLTLTAGQVAVIEPKMMHYGISGDDGLSYYAIMFDVEKFYNDTLASEKYLAPIVKYSPRFQRKADNEEIFDAFQRLIDLVRDNSRNPLCAVGIVYEILGLLYQHCEADSKLIYKFDQKFSVVIEYINEHFTEKITAGKVSQKFGYDETYFCRRFREITGITAMKYIKILRLEYAQKLLQGRQAEIGDIAWKCGFSDISYFSNCFKKQYGMSPSEFRKNAGKIFEDIV